MRKGRLGLFIGAAIIAAGCDATPDAGGDAIDGPYFLSSSILSPTGGKMICYLRKLGACDLRVPPSVDAVGVNDDFISARVRAPGAPSDDPLKKRYYYIVRDFDGPHPDLARTVRGPYDEGAFNEQRRKHGVPGVEKIVDA